MTEKLVGQEISCRIIKLDVAEEDAVVDRRVVLEEEEKQARERLLTDLKEGAIVRGTVRTLRIMERSSTSAVWTACCTWPTSPGGRVNKPADVLSVGDSVEVQVLKVDPAKRRISLGMKQLAPDPWSKAAETYRQGERVRGVVTRVTDFGAFVELEPGLEGLIHLSEMSWTKKARKPADLVKPGDVVEVVVPGERAARIAGAGSRRWAIPGRRWRTAHPAGAVVEGR